MKEGNRIEVHEGSWKLFLIIVTLVALRWTCFSKASGAIRLRRYVSQQVSELRVTLLCCAVLVILSVRLG
jgi:hypothetical protein